MSRRFLQTIMARLQIRSLLAFFHNAFHFGPSGSEQEKVVVTDSILTALRRCFVHLIPLSTCALIISLSLDGLCIGAEFVGSIKSETINLMLLQVAAKVNEILIVASLGFAILQVVRHELLYRPGLPLGLLGSGLAFSNLQIFFRSEFYGALKYLTCSRGLPRKIGFLFMLIVFGLVAALCGPASAVLIVPRSQIWNSGGTDYLMNGNHSDFHPSDIDLNLGEIRQYCAMENSTSFGICPAGGSYSLFEQWSRVNYTNFVHHNVPQFAKEMSGSSFYWPVRSPSSQLPPVYALGGPRMDNKDQSNTFIVQAHAPTAAVLQRIATGWWQALLSKTKLLTPQIDDRVVQAEVLSAITTVRCATPQELLAEDKSVQFPTIKGRFFYSGNLNLTVDLLDSSPSDRLRFQWVRLPEAFGAASIGAVFQTRWTVSGRSRIAIGCTAQSGWVPTTTFMDKYSFWTGWYPWNIKFGKREPAWTSVDSGQDQSSTNGRVHLSDGWLDLLTPAGNFPLSNQTNRQPSTIEQMLAAAGFSAAVEGKSGSVANGWLQGRDDDLGHGPLLETIIASVLVDGLSRSGGQRLYNTTGPAENWSMVLHDLLPNNSKSILSNKSDLNRTGDDVKRYLSGHVLMQISGYALQRSLATYLSMSVLLVYMTAALCHTAWVLVHRHTSRSWNSIAELVALAQNSRPAFDALKNTGGGIRSRKTFAQTAKIRARRHPETGVPDHIELIFENGHSEPLTEAPNKAGSISGLAEENIGLQQIWQPDSSCTWPGDAARIRIDDSTRHSRSSSSERLVPRVLIANTSETSKFVSTKSTAECNCNARQTAKP